MVLGIRDDKEWVGISEFLMRYSGLGKELKIAENVEKAKNKYYVLNGSVYDDEEEWMKDALSYQKLKACANCFEAPIKILMSTLQTELQEVV